VKLFKTYSYNNVSTPFLEDIKLYFSLDFLIAFLLSLKDFAISLIFEVKYGRAFIRSTVSLKFIDPKNLSLFSLLNTKFISFKSCIYSDLILFCGNFLES